MKKPRFKTGYYAKKYKKAKTLWSPSCDFSVKHRQLTVKGE
jgi:hypothetical protein